MSNTKRPRTRAEEFAALEEAAPRDFDPEDGAYGNGAESSDDDSLVENADKREHYEMVEKSKLRKPDVVPLGPQYDGSRISRKAVTEDEDDDDPSSREYEQDSGEESVMDQAEGGSSTEEEEGEEDMSGEESEGFSGTDITDEDGEDQAEAVDREELRKIMAGESKSVAATVSQAAKADAEKGRAVKGQRTTFDSLLNTRIKLQKALVSTNSLPTMEEVKRTSDNSKDPVCAAEAAALNLWTTLDSLRSTLETARTGDKRKRPNFNASTPSLSMWKHMQHYESSTLPHRQAVLEKWSSKSRAATTVPVQTRRLTNAANSQPTITDVLNGHLADPARLIARTRIPRSCAPVQAAARIPSSDSIYDDADFYGVLLKELLEQRSADTAAQLNGLSFQPQASWQAARDAKTKRQVDTRASKGRKLRYTVHEKLQNFMAPEDRGSWGERRADELFGSLFGRRAGLGEDIEDVMDEDEVGVEDGLVLFRS